MMFRKKGGGGEGERERKGEKYRWYSTDWREKDSERGRKRGRQ